MQTRFTQTAGALNVNGLLTTGTNAFNLAGGILSGSGSAVSLLAFDAATLRRLYTSSQLPPTPHFATQMTANGKVYVGTNISVVVYGLLSGSLTVATPTFSPAPGTYSSAQTVVLSDSTSGATVHCTIDGSVPTPSSPVCTSLTVSTTTTIKAIGVAIGLNDSAVATGTYTINPLIYQTEKLVASSSEPTFRIFSYAGFSDGVGTILDSTKPGDSVTLTVVRGTDKSQMKVNLGKAPDTSA